MGQARRRGTLEERIKNANFICIICRDLKESLQRSDEHVIPDSLNGYYHIYNVCKTCNSNMGASVDGVLLNHKLTELYRFSEKISGKSGKIPNPFKEVTSIKGNPDINVRTEISNSGELVHTTIPNVRTEENEDGTRKTFHLSVDVKDKKKLEGMRQKIIKRNNLENANLVSTDYIENIIEKPELYGQWEIDTLKFKLGLLKIAYEFAVDSIVEYFNDPLAIKISEILKDSNYEKINELKIGSGLDTELFESVENVLDIKKKRHILILLPTDQGLICFIKIDNLFHIGVQLSKRQFIPFERSIIGINDLETRSFIKKPFIELMNEASGLTYTRLGYWASNKEAIASELYEPKYSHFQYEVNSKGDPRLYKKNGKPHNLSWKSLLLNEDVDIEFKENLYIQLFSFGDDLGLFVKSIKTGSLYEIRSFELSREFSKF